MALKMDTLQQVSTIKPKPLGGKQYISTKYQLVTDTLSFGAYLGKLSTSLSPTVSQ